MGFFISIEGQCKDALLLVVSKWQVMLKTDLQVVSGPQDSRAEITAKTLDLHVNCKNENHFLTQVPISLR